MDLILIATNNESLRDLLNSMLGASRLLAHARSAGEMFEKVQNEPVDLVIVDEVLDNRPVSELLPKLFEIKKSAVVLILVSDAKLEQARKYRSLGVYDVLIKPLDEWKVEHTLMRSLQYARSLGEVTLLKDRLREMETGAKIASETKSFQVRLLTRETPETFQALRKLFEPSASVCNLQKLFEIILEAIADVLAINRAALIVVEEDGFKLLVKAFRGLDAELLEQMNSMWEFNVTRGIYRWLREHDRIMVTDDLSKDELAQLFEEVEILKARLCIPLAMKDKAKPLGYLSMSSKVSGEPYGKAELDFLFSFARYATALIESARLFEVTKERAVIDPLTQLFNRNHWVPRLKTEMERSKRYDRPLSIAIFDIDNFKLFNDTYGHQAGDKILSTVAALLLKSSRSTDVVGRYGGEEFVVILPETAHELAHVYCERVRLSVEELGKNMSPKLTISGGKTTFDPNNDTFETLIERADQALREAKGKGKNQVRNL